MHIILSILLLSLSSPAPVDSADALWDAMSQTVAAGDFEGYSALYHDDAVLVSGFTNNSYPISDALAGWKQGFDDTRDGKMTAGVEFRFTKKLSGPQTAHYTGMFNYTSQMTGGEPQAFVAHFEGLMVQKDGAWKLVMEYQKSAATPEEWAAAE